MVCPLGIRTRLSTMPSPVLLVYKLICILFLLVCLPFCGLPTNIHLQLLGPAVTERPIDSKQMTQLLDY